MTLLNALLLIAQDDPGRGDDPGGAGGVILIVAGFVVLLAVGIFLARKVFTRGTLPDTPSDDAAQAGEEPSVGSGDQPGVEADPRAMGRPSDRGYEQNPKGD